MCMGLGDAKNTVWRIGMTNQVLMSRLGRRLLRSPKDRNFVGDSCWVGFSQKRVERRL